MRYGKSLVTLAAVAVLWLAAICQPVTAAVYGDKVVLTILSVNDFHGALAEIPGKNPGAAKLAAYLLGEKAKDQNGTLIVSGGDMFQGSVDSNLLYGEPVIEVMNYVGFDAMALGNHEFDWGLDKLKGIKTAAKFPIGAANVIDKHTKQLPEIANPGNEALPCSLFVRDGVKIGIIYLTTPETAAITNQKAVGGLNFTSPLETVKLIAPKLKSLGAEVIVVVSHLSSAQDGDGKVTGDAADLASEMPAGMIDAVVSGHTHLSVAGKVQAIPIIQAHHYGWQVGKIQLTYSKSQKKVIESDQSYVDVKNVSGLMPDSKAAEIIEKYHSKIAAIKNEVIGQAASELSHERFAPNVSVLGKWVTDVMRKRTGADFAFQNGGGLRSSLQSGNITMGNLYEALPFDNNIITVSLTGQQIKNILEHGIHNEKIGMIQFSGAVVEYDLGQAQGNRVTAITLLNGTPLDSQAVYKVAANDFLATGGDGYSMFKEGTNVHDTGLNLRDVLCEAIKTAGIVNYQDDNRLVIK